MKSNAEKAKQLQDIFDKIKPSKGAGAAPGRVQISGAGVAPIEIFQTDPSDGGSYTNCSSLPLFSKISPDDISQYGLADCYFLACLGSMASTEKGRAYLPTICFYDPTNPSKVIVCFQRNGTVTRIHTDLMIGSVQAKFNPADSDLWVEIFEKAYAYYRQAADTFASLNYGYSQAVASDLGCLPVGSLSIATPFDTIRTALSNQQILTICTTTTPGLGLVGNHEYFCLSIDSANNIYLENPWGFSGGVKFVTIAPADMKTTNFNYYEYGTIPAVTIDQSALIAQLEAKLAQALLDIQNAKNILGGV